MERTRELMVTDLAALVGESYERAYTDMVRVQQLAELEEVCAYKQALDRRAGEGEEGGGRGKGDAKGGRDGREPEGGRGG